MSENKSSTVPIQEQLSFLVDFKKRYGNLADYGVPKTSILQCSLKPFKKVAADVQGIRTADEMLQRSLNALKLARVRYRMYPSATVPQAENSIPQGASKTKLDS